jgi:uroporphyrin-III C-methyltransferase
MAETTPGKVYLVGAGPGDPELLTLKAARLLQEAEAVVYDALVSPEILAHVGEGAERRFVGKREGRHPVPQEEINEILVELGRSHRVTVRLKGGDPYLFGRGAEEECYLREHGIVVEVVPGITSALAVPAAAGIPLTHRDFASAVVIATGHRRIDMARHALDWRSLGALGATVSVLMGVSNLDEILGGLMEGGMAATTPAALIQWGTTPRQREVVATLGTLIDAAKDAGIGAPSVLVVGEVVTHRCKGEAPVV